MLGTLKVLVYVNISAIKYPCIVLPEGTCYGMDLPLFSDKRESKWCDGLVNNGREYWHIFW
jgi:hypothetical protein